MPIILLCKYDGSRPSVESLLNTHVQAELDREAMDGRNRVIIRRDSGAYFHHYEAIGRLICH